MSQHTLVPHFENYFTVCIIDTDQQNLRLSPSLSIQDSQLFENVLFVVFKTFNDDLRNDFIQFSQEVDQLPPNVIYLESFSLVNQVIGQFKAKNNSKIIFFSDRTLKDVYNDCVRYDSDLINQKRIDLIPPQMFNEIKEDALILNCGPDYKLTQPEKLLVQPTLSTIFFQLQQPKKFNIPKNIFELLPHIQNIIQNKAKELNLEDQVEYEKMACEIFFELVTNSILNIHPDIYYLVVSRQLRTYNDFNKITQLEVNYDFILTSSPIDENINKQEQEKIQETAKFRIQSNSIETLQQVQSNGLSSNLNTGLTSMKQNHLQTNSQILTSSLPINQKEVQFQQNMSAPLAIQQTQQQQLSTQNYQQDEKAIIHGYLKNSTPQPQPMPQFQQTGNLVAANLQPTFLEFIKEILHVFFDTFQNSNLPNTFKPLSVHKSMVNYGTNLIKKKESQKVKPDQIVNLIQEAKQNKSLLNLASFNALLFLHYQKFLEFTSDKTLTYEINKIASMAKSSFEHIFSNQNVVYSLKVGDDFEKNPFLVMKSQLKIAEEGSKQRQGSSSSASTAMETIINQKFQQNPENLKNIQNTQKISPQKVTNNTLDSTAISDNSFDQFVQNNNPLLKQQQVNIQQQQYQLLNKQQYQESIDQEEDKKQQKNQQ